MNPADSPYPDSRPLTGKVKTQDQQLQELRDAVLAMAISLGAALPNTREVISSLDALVDTYPNGGR